MNSALGCSWAWGGLRRIEGVVDDSRISSRHYADPCALTLSLQNHITDEISRRLPVNPAASFSHIFACQKDTSFSPSPYEQKEASLFEPRHQYLIRWREYPKRLRSQLWRWAKFLRSKSCVSSLGFSAHQSRKWTYSWKRLERGEKLTRQAMAAQAVTCFAGMILLFN